MKRIPDEAAKETDREFKETGREARKLDIHGPFSGTIEFVRLVKRHPVIEFFFKYFDEVSPIDPKTKNRIGKLEEQLLKGTLNYQKTCEFIKQDVHPFYQDFFENAPELLGLESEEHDEFLQLEVQYRKKKHHLIKEEWDKLDSYMSRFYKKRVEEQEKKKAT